jgi:hypothetical protein
VGTAATHAKQTHCIHGHPFAGDNLYDRPTGGRACRTCHNRASREFRARSKVVA